MGFLVGEQNALPFRQKAAQKVLQSVRVLYDPSYVKLSKALVRQLLHEAICFSFLQETATEVLQACLPLRYEKAWALHSAQKSEQVFFFRKELLIFCSSHKLCKMNAFLLLIFKGGRPSIFNVIFREEVVEEVCCR